MGRLLAAPGIAYHRWRRSRLENRQRREGDRVDRRAERQAAAQRLRGYPPADALLPTGLGNVLRAAELRAGERYGLDSLVTWPRLYPVLGEQVRALADDRRDQLDLSVRFCVVFAVATPVLLALLAPYGWWLAVPAGTFALAWLSYRAAIAAAAGYGEALETAFDLHRFDLLRALHLPLPDDLATEPRANEQVSAFLRQPFEYVFLLQHGGEAGNIRYVHSDGDARRS